MVPTPLHKAALGSLLPQMGVTIAGVKMAQLGPAAIAVGLSLAAPIPSVHASHSCAFAPADSCRRPASDFPQCYLSPSSDRSGTDRRTPPMTGDECSRALCDRPAGERDWRAASLARAHPCAGPAGLAMGSHGWWDRWQVTRRDRTQLLGEFGPMGARHPVRACACLSAACVCQPAGPPAHLPLCRRVRPSVKQSMGLSRCLHARLSPPPLRASCPSGGRCHV